MIAALNSPPPEWAPQDKILIGWPSHFEPWDDPFDDAREEVAELANRIIGAGKHYSGSETTLVLVVDGAEARDVATRMVPKAEIINTACGDTWLRDTAGTFSWQNGRLTLSRYRFNGWGGKYIYPGDADLAPRLAKKLNTELVFHDFILEGGAVEWDGAGNLLTTEDCLLNPNRNKGWGREDAERALIAAFGAKRIIWLRDGLLNDHTDGHIDNLARFVAPGHIAYQVPADDDPHTDRLREIEADLRLFRERNEADIKLTAIPSPGRVLDPEGDFMPASHMNFVITNQLVVVPEYNARAREAVSVLQGLFPERPVVSSPSNAILTGGGSFHCISQQIPSSPAKDKA